MSLYLLMSYSLNNYSKKFNKDQYKEIFFVKPNYIMYVFSCLQCILCMLIYIFKNLLVYARFYIWETIGKIRISIRVGLMKNGTTTNLREILGENRLY